MSARDVPLNVPSRVRLRRAPSRPDASRSHALLAPGREPRQARTRVRRPGDRLRPVRPPASSACLHRDPDDQWILTASAGGGTPRDDGKKPLHVRTWRCGGCGTEHDRDLNASRVIFAAGQAERLNAPGGPVSPGVEIPRQARPLNGEPTRSPSRSPPAGWRESPSFGRGRMSTILCRRSGSRGGVAVRQEYPGG
ncbi:zinc ribbon domain-containing protein [Streptomyces sp. NPDC048637]|uniref:zinc ribbon domain-containing protein n=1 Tax=Streptomyces sp. NPDC048637 TaxID=3155636 RepID=UPI003422CC24